MIAPSTDWVVRGFTFGEALTRQQCSVVIEKTDLRFKGLAQYIFSEFCATKWSACREVNVGDDWGLETLAWTKKSYRPIRHLAKHTMSMKRRPQVAAA